MNEPTAEEIKNGWTAESLAAYRALRDIAAGDRVPGNVVTPWTPPKQPIRIENASTYNPHTKWRR